EILGERYRAGLGLTGEGEGPLCGALGIRLLLGRCREGSASRGLGRRERPVLTRLLGPIGQALDLLDLDGRCTADGLGQRLQTGGDLRPVVRLEVVGGGDGAALAVPLDRSGDG